MFLYELVTLLRPFELAADHPDNLIRKKQRPQVPKSKVARLGCTTANVCFLYRRILPHVLFNVL